jgi:hypothetical protein
MGLRPVRFRYKADGPEGSEQYGLIAEEVVEVAPELAGRGQDGQIDFVHYEKVNAMLLNEVQKQHHTIETQMKLLQSQQAEIGTRGEQIDAQQDRIRDLQQQISELRAALASLSRQ